MTKRIVKWAVYILLFGVYFAIMARIFMTCEPDAVKYIYLDSRAQNIKDGQETDFSVYKRIIFNEIITDDGIYAFDEIYYLENLNQLQIMFRTKNKEEHTSLVIRDSNGNIYDGESVYSIGKGKYTYDVVIFYDIPFFDDIENEKYVYVQKNGGDIANALLYGTRTAYEMQKDSTLKYKKIDG